MPIVIALCLIIWLSAIFYANAHPSRGRHSVDIRTEVRGGSFQAVEGGRQLEPIPGHGPAVPSQRSATASEIYQPEAAAGVPAEGAEQRSLAGHSQGQGQPPA